MWEDSKCEARNLLSFRRGETVSGGTGSQTAPCPSRR